VLRRKLLPGWLMVAVEPACWPAAGSGTKVSALCKSVTCQAKDKTKTAFIATSQEPKMTADDDRK